MDNVPEISTRLETVYACLTTIPGREKALEETVASLLPQVDRLYIFLHGYNPTELPDFLDTDLNPKLELNYDIEWGDNGDSDKFHFVKNLNLQGYILICDDDLIYPPDYAERMIEAIDKHDNKALITAHGSIMFPLPIANYYMDRYTFPCLGDVMEETVVQIGGTGVMAFHSSIGFDLDFKDKLTNMADVHVGIWALEKEIPIYVIPHLTGWIKHSEYVKQEDTIAGKNLYDTYGQVEAINSRPSLFKSKFKVKRKRPKVSIVVINSRLRSHPMLVKQCFDSLRKQTYTNIQIIVIENTDKMMTIGKCYNEGVRRAKGKYVLFVGDDDFISDDYASILVGIIETSDLTKTVGVSSYLTLFHENKTNKDMVVQEPRELIPTGMWLRSYLKKYPFKEYLTRYIDSEFMEKARERGDNLLVARHNYGYYYRSHPGQVSGYKQLGGNHSNIPNSKELINKRLKEIEQI